MNIDIRPIQASDYQKAHAFQCDYLDSEDFQGFLNRIAQHPAFYLVAMDGDELVGVCYGSPSQRQEGTLGLQGIAVNLDETKAYARVGIGSSMLAQFEAVAREHGFLAIGLGSADDLKVESFYLKNGYRPTQIVANSESWAEVARVDVDDYAAGSLRREQLRRQLQAREVIFIFEKSLE